MGIIHSCRRRADDIATTDPQVANTITPVADTATPTVADTTTDRPVADRDSDDEEPTVADTTTDPPVADTVFYIWGDMRDMTDMVDRFDHIERTIRLLNEKRLEFEECINNDPLGTDHIALQLIADMIPPIISFEDHTREGTDLDVLVTLSDVQRLRWLSEMEVCISQAGRQVVHFFPFLADAMRKRDLLFGSSPRPEDLGSVLHFERGCDWIDDWNRKKIECLLDYPIREYSMVPL
jgi:hypothetical protein